MGKPQFRYGRMVVLAAAIAALGLSGCGRKSGLDLPPSAALTDPNAQPPGTAPNGQPVPAQGAAAQPGQPASPPAPPRRFLLDFLLN